MSVIVDSFVVLKKKFVAYRPYLQKSLQLLLQEFGSVEGE